ncbi:MAG TPA: hypothetical protein EYN54_02535, partial [Methylococcaceae bacterium]|nr:hypothetical protein [Methylococcaceae bacterium]
MAHTPNKDVRDALDKLRNRVKNMKANSDARILENQQAVKQIDSAKNNDHDTSESMVIGTVDSNKELTDIVKTMSSIVLLEHINGYRKEEGKPIQTHSNFMKKVRDELDDDADLYKGTYTGKDNAPANCFYLPEDECMRLAARESKAVRKSMIKKLRELSEAYNNQAQPVTAQPVAPALPNFNNPAEAARAWADAIEQKEVAQIQLKESVVKVQYCDTVLNSDGGLRTTEIA